MQKLVQYCASSITRIFNIDVNRDKRGGEEFRFNFL